MRVRHAVVILLGVVLLALLLCGDAGAQQSPAAAASRPAGALQPELRLDAFPTTSPGSVQLGAGGVVALGHYVRLSGVLAAEVPNGGPGLRGGVRADLIARFLLDPFRQSGWGVALGGGVSVRQEPERGTWPVLALTLDVDPPGKRAWQPSAQVALAGGLRVGVGVRRTRAMRR